MISEFDYSLYFGLEMCLSKGVSVLCFLFYNLGLQNIHASVQTYTKIWSVLKYAYDLVRVSIFQEIPLYFDQIQYFNLVAIQKAHHLGKGTVRLTEKVTKSDIVGRGCGQK